MTLGDLIERLKQEDPNRILPLGFTTPHSYRGNYYDLAFEPQAGVTVGAMLRAATFADGETFVGYKGGDFTMSEASDVHLAKRGCSGEELGPMFLELLLGYPEKALELAEGRGR